MTIMAVVMCVLCGAAYGTNGNVEYTRRRAAQNGGWLFLNGRGFCVGHQMLSGVGSPGGSGALMAGLGAYYRLDGDLTDSSGNGRDLTGSGTYQAGKLNQELATGSGARTPVGGVTDAAVTISAWLTSTTGGSGDGIGCSVGFGGALLAARVADDSVQWLFDSGAEWSELVSAATRYHVAVTLNGTTAKLYLNGSQVYTGTVPVASGWSSDIFQVQTTGDVTTPVDEVAVYTRAITAAEVSALYNSGLGFDPTP